MVFNQAFIAIKVCIETSHVFHSDVIVFAEVVDRVLPKRWAFESWLRLEKRRQLITCHSRNIFKTTDWRRKRMLTVPSRASYKYRRKLKQRYRSWPRVNRFLLYVYKLCGWSDCSYFVILSYLISFWTLNEEFWILY